MNIFADLGHMFNPFTNPHGFNPFREDVHFTFQGPQSHNFHSNLHNEVVFGQTIPGGMQFQTRRSSKPHYTEILGAAMAAGKEYCFLPLWVEYVEFEMIL